MPQGKVGTKIVIDGVPEYRAAINDIKSAQSTLRSEMRLLSAEFKNTANSEEALKAKQEVLTKQIEQDQKKVDLLTRAVKGYEKELEAAKQRIEEAKAAHGAESEEVKKAEAEYQRLQRGLNQYQGQLNNAKTDLVTHNQELEKTDKYLQEASSSTDKCAKSIDQFGREVKESGEEIKSTDEALEAFAKSEIFEKFAESAEQMVETLKECVEAADEFEYAMTKVQSIAQWDDSAMAGMGESIQDLAVTYGASANEIAEATYQAISASVDASEATAFVGNAMKLARGGFTDTVTAVDVLTTTLNAYGKEANTTEHIMDALVTTQNLGKTTVGELAQNLGQIIPTAAGLNVSLDNLAAAYIQLTKNGVNTANATTYLNGMLTELSKKGTDVSDVLEEETGKSFGQLMAEGKSLGDVIQILGDHVNGDSEAFLNLFGNVRAAKGALTIFNNTADAFNESLAAVGDSTGAANQAFETMADTSEMTSKRMDAAVENLKVSIGEALQPTIDGLKEVGISMLEPINEFVEAHPEVVGALAGIATGVMGVTTAVAACAAAVAILHAAFGDLSSAAAVLGTAAVTGGILGISMTTKSAANEVHALADEAMRTAREMDEIDASYQAQGQTITELTNKVKLLQVTEGELSDTQRTDMIVAVEQLNQLFPELDLVIDDTTGKIANYTEEIDKNIDSLVEQYKWQLKQEEAQEIIEKIADLELKQAEAEEKLAEAKQKVIDIQGQRDTTAEVNDLDRAQAKYDDLTRKIEECKEQYGDLIQETKGATEATKENADAQEEAGTKTQQMSEDLEKLIEQYNKAKEAARDSLETQRDKFQEMGEAARKGEEAVTLTMDDMLQAFTDQNDAIRDYQDNVNKVAEFMLRNDWSQGLLASIIADGPASADKLQLVADAISGDEEELQKLKKASDEFDGFSRATYQMDDFIAALNTEGIPVTEEMIQKNRDLYDSRGFLIKTYEEGSNAFDEYAQKTEETAAQLPEDAANAVTGAAGAVAEAEEKMITDAIDVGYGVLGMDGEGSESTVFKGMGEQVVSSFAAGLADEGGLVSGAMQSLCEAAVNAVDISGLVDKLSENVAKVVSDAEAKFTKDLISDTSRKANMGGGE